MDGRRPAAERQPYRLRPGRGCWRRTPVIAAAQMGDFEGVVSQRRRVD